MTIGQALIWLGVLLMILAIIPWTIEFLSFGAFDFGIGAEIVIGFMAWGLVIGIIGFIARELQ